MNAVVQTLTGWFASRGESAVAALPVRLGGRGSFSATTTPAIGGEPQQGQRPGASSGPI